MLELHTLIVLLLGVEVQAVARPDGDVPPGMVATAAAQGISRCWTSGRRGLGAQR
jgi:hypothetical protein